MVSLGLQIQCSQHYALEKNVERVAQSQNDRVEQDFVLIGTSDNVKHDIALHLEDYDSVVVQDNVTVLLGRLLRKSLLERLLILELRVWVCAGEVVGRGICRSMRGRVVFGEDAR